MALVVPMAVTTQLTDVNFDSACKYSRLKRIEPAPLVLVSFPLIDSKCFFLMCEALWPATGAHCCASATCHTRYQAVAAHTGKELRPTQR